MEYASRVDSAAYQLRSLSLLDMFVTSYGIATLESSFLLGVYPFYMMSPANKINGVGSFLFRSTLLGATSTLIID